MATRTPTRTPSEKTKLAMNLSRYIRTNIEDGAVRASLPSGVMALFIEKPFSCSTILDTPFNEVSFRASMMSHYGSWSRDKSVDLGLVWYYFIGPRHRKHFKQTAELYLPDMSHWMYPLINTALYLRAGANTPPYYSQDQCRLAWDPDSIGFYYDGLPSIFYAGEVDCPSWYVSAWHYYASLFSLTTNMKHFTPSHSWLSGTAMNHTLGWIFAADYLDDLLEAIVKEISGDVDFELMSDMNDTSDERTAMISRFHQIRNLYFKARPKLLEEIDLLFSRTHHVPIRANSVSLPFYLTLDAFCSAYKEEPLPPSTVKRLATFDIGDMLA